MPVDVAIRSASQRSSEDAQENFSPMQEPGSGVVSCEPNSDIVTSGTDAHYVASNGVCIVVRGAACTSHYIEGMLLKYQRKNKKAKWCLTPCKWNGCCKWKFLLLWKYNVNRDIHRAPGHQSHQLELKLQQSCLAVTCKWIRGEVSPELSVLR